MHHHLSGSYRRMCFSKRRCSTKQEKHKVKENRRANQRARGRKPQDANGHFEREIHSYYRMRSTQTGEKNQERGRQIGDFGNRETDSEKAQGIPGVTQQRKVQEYLVGSLRSNPYR